MSSAKRNRLACTFPSSCNTGKEINRTQTPSNTGQNTEKQGNDKISTSSEHYKNESYKEPTQIDTGEYSGVRCHKNGHVSEPNVGDQAKNLSFSKDGGHGSSCKTKENHYNRQAFYETDLKCVPEMQEQSSSQFGHLKNDDCESDSKSAKDGWATWKVPSLSQEGNKKSFFDGIPQKMSLDTSQSYDSEPLSSLLKDKQKPAKDATKNNDHKYIQVNEVTSTTNDCKTSSTNDDKMFPKQSTEVTSTTNDVKTFPFQTMDVSSLTTNYDPSQNLSSPMPAIYSHFGVHDICADFRSKMTSGKDICPTSSNDAPCYSNILGLSNIPASKREEVQEILRETSAGLQQGMLQMNHKTEGTDVTDQDLCLSDPIRHMRLADKASEDSSGKVSGDCPSVDEGSQEKVPMPKGSHCLDSSGKTPSDNIQRIDSKANLPMPSQTYYEDSSGKSLVKEVLSEDSHKNLLKDTGFGGLLGEFQDVRPKQPNLFKSNVVKHSDTRLNKWTFVHPERSSRKEKVEVNDSGHKDSDSLLDLSEDSPSLRLSLDMHSKGLHLKETSTSELHIEVCDTEVKRKEESTARQQMEPELLVVKLPEVGRSHHALELPTEGPDAKENSKLSSQKSLADSDGSFSSLPPLEGTPSPEGDPEIIITANAKALLQQERSTGNFATALISEEKSNSLNAAKLRLGQRDVTCEDVSDDRSMPPLQRNSLNDTGKFVIPEEKCKELRSLIDSLNDDKQLVVQVQGDDVQTTALQQRHQGRQEAGINVIESDNVQVVKNLQLNKFEMTAGSIHNIKSQTQGQLNSTDKLFVETDFYEEVAGILDKENVVFVIGPPSAGKRMTSLGLLRKYKEQGFEPFIIRNVTEMRDIVNAETKQAIYFPNMFGPFEFDQQKCDEWAEYFKTLMSCGFEKKKYIFSCRSRIFKRGAPCLSMLNLCYHSVVYDIISPQPPEYEFQKKKKILTAHLSAKQIQLSERLIENISDCESTHLFPKLCEIFASNRDIQNEANAVQFFKKPVLYYKTMIRHMSERVDKTSFAVLYLLMLYRKLEKNFFENFQQNEVVKCDLAVFDLQMSRSSIQEAAESMLGSFVKRSEGSFMFIDPCVYDAVALVCGGKYPKKLVQSCSAKFLSNNILVAEEQVTDPEVQVLLVEEEIDFLSERFVQEVRKGNLYLVSRHKAFTHSAFVRRFVRYFKKEDDFKSLLVTKDQFGMTWLYWSAWNKKEHLFKWILESFKNLKLKIKSLEMSLIVRACCVSGNIEVLRISFDTVKKLSAMVSCPKMESIHLPEDMVAGYEEAKQNGGAIQVGHLLHTACLSGHLSIVKLLVDNYGAKTKVKDDSGYLPINIAARYGHLEIVQYLISRGVKINHIYPNSKTVLQDACEGLQTEVVEFLVKECPSLVQVKDSDNRQPLHHATLSKDAKMVHCLLSQGAGPESEDKNGNSAVHTACMKSRNLHVLKELKPSPPQINKKNKHGRTCLHLACKHGGCPMVSYLLHKEADANVVDCIGQTPLHLASEGNKHPVVKKLLEVEGIDAFVLDVRGKAAIHLTTNDIIVRMLKKQAN